MARALFHVDLQAIPAVGIGDREPTLRAQQ
jgi:hypothetical protein